MVGIAPSGAHGPKSVSEKSSFQDPVDGIIGGRVEVACDDGGEPGVIGLLFESGENVGQFNFPLSAVLTMLPPAIPAVEFQIGGG